MAHLARQQTASECKSAEISTGRSGGGMLSRPIQPPDQSVCTRTGRESMAHSQGVGAYHPT